MQPHHSRPPEIAMAVRHEAIRREQVLEKVYRSDLSLTGKTPTKGNTSKRMLSMIMNDTNPSSPIRSRIKFRFQQELMTVLERGDSCAASFPSSGRAISFIRFGQFASQDHRLRDLVTAC